MLWYFRREYYILEACDGVGGTANVNCHILSILVENTKNTKKLLIISLIGSIINS